VKAPDLAAFDGREEEERSVAQAAAGVFRGLGTVLLERAIEGILGLTGRGSLTKVTVGFLLAATTVIAGCSSNSSTRPLSGGTSHSPVTSPTGAAVTGLVGRWERVTSCQELVSELDKAGLGPLAPYAWSEQTSSTGLSSFASGSPKPTKAHPCTGALKREHSHFFSQPGQFGSLDWLGGKVDDGPYRIINDNTVYIGSPPAGATFHHRILHGDTLMLSPVLTKAMLRQALAHPQKFSAAFWAVSVAYAGSTWKRVPCQSWC
jgi:hypothetical protein